MDKQNKQRVKAGTTKGIPASKQKTPKSSKKSVPLAQAKVMRVSQPSVITSDGRVRIRHREYIQDVSGSIAFSNSSLNINPGLASTFPWLSNMAMNYESYLFRKLRFDFETAKSASTSGEVILAIDYDASDAAAATKSQLMSYYSAVRGPTWTEISCIADPSDLQKFGVQRYVRNAPLASNLDIKTYDVGILNLATNGCADTSALGSLFVEYEIELITPQTPSGTSSYLDSAKVTGSSPSLSSWFGTTGTVAGNLPVTASGNTLTFNCVGQFLITYQASGTTMTVGNGVQSGTVAAASAIVTYVTAAATSYFNEWYVNVTAPGQTMTVDFSARAATITATITRIAAYQYSLA